MKQRDRDALKLALPALEELSNGIEKETYESWISGESHPDDAAVLRGTRQLLQLARNAATRGGIPDRAAE